MKIINRTHFQTAPLARIARRVLTLECKGRAERRARASRLVLTIGYNRSYTDSHKRNGWKSGGGCSGHAYIRGNSFSVNVPSDRVNALDFAFVVGHELGHVWGFNHDEMIRVLHYARGGPSNTRYAWASAITIAKREPRRKVRPTVDAKLDHARKMLRRAETRAKRATTFLKKWQRRLRALERRNALEAATRTATATTTTAPSEARCDVAEKAVWA